ncbi:MAG: YceI family protein [Myxococcaceae bacterium]|nr:YceI family protein [Myxococcaceae bacterium]
MNVKSLLAAAVLCLPSLALGASYEIDPVHSSANFNIKHLMVATVRGEFTKVSGTVTLDEKAPKKSVVEATIDAASIDTHEAKRDNHLKSPDFFDVAKFPTLTFKSTDVKKLGKGKYEVKGDLTMHGVTKPVVLAVDAPDTEVKDPGGNIRRGATATTKLDRKDFGLKWNQALEAGGVMVGDDVDVTLHLELVKKDGKLAETK